MASKALIAGFVKAIDELHENAAATQRKCDDAGRELLRARSDLKELQQRFARVQVEARTLSDLNARVEKARHVGDLFPAS